MLDFPTPRRVVARALLATLLSSIPAGAALATIANTPLCVATYNQMPPSGVSNGAGGTLVTWTDNRSGDRMHDPETREIVRGIAGGAEAAAVYIDGVSDRGIIEPIIA